MNDWSKRPLIPLNVPHPDSPAGRNFDWSSLGVPHPNSPAGGIFDYWSALGVRHPASPAGRMLGKIEVRPPAGTTSEGASVGAVNETPYEQAVRTLDFRIIKKISIETWSQSRKWPVKVFKLRPGQKVGDSVEIDGFITTEQSAAGASLRELETRMGFASGYLGDSAAICRLDRLPMAPEFDLRFYNNIHGGGVKPPDPRFPLGPGYPQWELLRKIPAHITQIISK